MSVADLQSDSRFGRRIGGGERLRGRLESKTRIPDVERRERTSVAAKGATNPTEVPRRPRMTEPDVFILADGTLNGVVARITDEQWAMAMPASFAMRHTDHGLTLRE